MAPISFEQLCLFHKMDREIFSCLVIHWARNPSQTLLIMALWLWLENIGYVSIISKLVGLHPTIINDVAQEAGSCLMCLEQEEFPIPNDGGLLRTTTIVERKISLRVFKQNRFTIIAGIKNVLNKTCSIIFNDILLQVLGRNCASRLPLPHPYRPIIVPGFPHQVFGEFNIPPTNFKVLDLTSFEIWTNMRLFDDVMDIDKTVFITFSRGFPVTKREVVYFFTNTFGVDCIKTIRMGNAKSSHQVMYAIVVLNYVETLDRILNGGRIAKYCVNGKQLWVRKYERRE